MAVTRYHTAGQILNRTAKKLGIIPQDLPDPVGSTDPEMVRLLGLLNDVGQELAEQYEWRHLLIEHSITGNGVTTDYDLPADFLDMVPQSGWNRTTDLPLAGPLSVQLWQYRQAITFLPVYAEFRIDTNTVRFNPAIPNGQNVRFEYKSRAWVRPAASGLGNGNTLGVSGSDEVAVQGDFVLFDPLLMRRQLALAWREDNGFRTDKAQEQAQRSLDAALERSTGAAPVLNLSRRRGRAGLSGRVPDGSWSI